MSFSDATGVANSINDAHSPSGFLLEKKNKVVEGLR